MIISSMKVAMVPWLIISQKRLFIIVWKVAGELVSLKYMTIGLYASIYVIKTIFHSSPSLILMLLYPYLKSNFVNTFLLPTPSRISAISGNG